MPKHIVVDGSNLATEGRSMPSLKQLSDAVEAYLEEHPTELVTVVVDATFGHRIDPREVSEFEEAIEHNELVAPPAGAVGRGDAFVLAIADKVDAVILSNDSFQEFHGEYPWLFDEGRLVGGKPVPHVGWVFVERIPVRGPLSRKSTRNARQKEPKDVVRTSAASLQPMPVPKAPPPRTRARDGEPRSADAARRQPAADGGRRQPAAEARAPRSTTPDRAAAEPAARPTAAAPAAPARNAMVNDLMPFLEFVERHPVGSLIDVVVETYSSHGAYVTGGGARAYLPLRNISDPPPRSARELYKLGETVTMQVAAFHPQRRGIDLAIPGVVAGLVAPAKPARGRAKKAQPVAVPEAPPAAERAPLADAASRRTGRGARAAAMSEDAVQPASAPVAVAGAGAGAGRGRRKAAATPEQAQAAPVEVPAPAAPPAPKAAPRGRAPRPRPTAVPVAAAAVVPEAIAVEKPARSRRAPAKEVESVTGDLAATGPIAGGRRRAPTAGAPTAPSPPVVAPASRTASRRKAEVTAPPAPQADSADAGAVRRAGRRAVPRAAPDGAPDPGAAPVARRARQRA